MRRLVVAMCLVTSLCVAAPGTAQEPPPPPPAPCEGCYVPPPGVRWQYQLRSAPDPARPFDLWIVDMFETEASHVAALRSTGGRVACYVSAGSWEDWRPDAADFPDRVLGKRLDGWPGERWLDVRALDELAPIMSARLDSCAAKGFDAVDFDNVNGYLNDTGFDLDAGAQLAYNRWLANAAHERGLSVGLKNDGEQAAELVPYFDFAVVEQCFLYRECRLYRPFADAGKAVLEVEYELGRKEFCTRAEVLTFNAIRKRYALGAWRRACP
ncbi:MAG TPA: endo alpha-1,4 polygalactosaminidase [Actinomycetota bacterium]